MKRLLTLCIAALGLGFATPALAQHVTPAPSSFAATGTASLNGTICTLTLNADIDSTGAAGTITGGSNTGSGICPLITIDSGAIHHLVSYDPSGNGSAVASLSGLVVRVGGAVACTQVGSLDFTITNDGSGGSTIGLSGMIGPCSVTATLAAPIEATS